MSFASRIAALRAMANQDASPREAEIAREKLLAMGAGHREPPRRPPSAADRESEEEERERAELVRRWEQGQFTGWTMRMGTSSSATFNVSSWGPGNSTSGTSL